MTRKLFCAVLAVFMLIGVFTFSAAAQEDTAKFTAIPPSVTTHGDEDLIPGRFGMTTWSTRSIAANYPNNAPADVDTVEEKVDWIAGKCREAGMTEEWDIAVWLHDWLIYNANYDYTYSIYRPEGVLLMGTGVCQSYAEAYELLLDEFGIENTILSAHEMNHAWNLVKIDGEWCHVDCTWDDPGEGGYENHNYFGMTDTMISADHVWNTNTYVDCTSKINYYPIRMGYLVCETEEEFLAILDEQAALRTEQFDIYYIGGDPYFSMATYFYDWYESNYSKYQIGGWGYIDYGTMLSLSVSYWGGHTHSYSAAVTDPTCTEEGYTAYTCSCGASYISDRVDALGHSWGEWIVTEEATCTEDGEHHRVCARCDYNETEVIEAPGHNYEVAVTEPTCTEDGFTTYTCSTCGNVYTDNYVDATGHYVLRPGVGYVDAYTLHNSTTDPFDLIDGWYASTNKSDYSTSTFRICADYDCTMVLKYKVSSEQYYDILEIVVNGNTIVIASGEMSETSITLNLTAGDVVSVTYSKDISVSVGSDTGYFKIDSCTQIEEEALLQIPAEEAEPTCTEAVICESCSMTIKEALGHSWDAGTVTKEPTEEENGTMLFTCERCGETREEPLSKQDHVHEYTSVVTDPTCTEKGYTTYTCECGNSFVDTYVNALDHKWDAGIITKEPTEEATGTKLFTCEHCDETREETLPALDHVHAYTPVVTDPTCTEKGYTTHTCACGNSFVDTYVNALDHKWDAGIITKEPTEDAEGIKLFTCEHCGETREETLPALDHVHAYTSVVTDPTCTGQGYTTHTCSCGDSFVENYVPATGHIFIGSDCLNCHAVDESFENPTCGTPVSVLHDRMAALQKHFPEGMPWTNDHYYGWNGGIYSGGYGCAGFAFMLSDAAFGSLPAEIINEDISISKIRVGDILRVNGNTHSVIVLEVHADYVVIAEGNFNYSIHWGRELTAKNIIENVDYIMTRYPDHHHTSVVTEPTCTEQGYTTHTCECGDRFVDSYVDALGHKWDDGVITKEPTEEETGTKLFTCERCGETREEPLSEQDHVHEYTSVVTDPTCTEQGYTTYTCACGDSYEADFVDATGHRYENSVCTECGAAESIADGACGENLTWTLDEDGTLTISGSGAMTDFESYYRVPWSSYRSSIKKIVIGDGVTGIGDYAFCDCNGLTSVTIPDGVTGIGEYAFSGCSSLTSITLPDGVTDIGYGAFSDCKALTSIVIPDSVTGLGGGVFSDCDALTSVTIGNSVTRIGAFAFSCCGSLTSVVLPDSVTSIGMNAFEECAALTSIVLPDSVTSIENNAFYGCRSLSSVTIPAGATSIGERAFYGCRALTSVVLPEGMTSIGYGAFSGCSSLKSVTIPDSMTGIGEYAFDGCSLSAVYITDIAAWLSIEFVGDYSNPLSGNAYLYLNEEALTELVIPDSVTSIGDYAFYDYGHLTSVVIPDSVTSIGKNAFYSCNSLNAVYITDIAAWLSIDFRTNYSNPLCGDAYLYLNEELLTDIVIPEGVTSIGNFAFYDYDHLTSVVIPDSVTSIGDGTFAACDALTAIVLPEGVTSIGNYLFMECSALTSIVIPEGVTDIGNYAFSECDALTSIVLPEGVTSIGDYAFSECNALTNIVIPKGVTSIGSNAFSGCYYLTSITIPDSVTSIGKFAFSGCDNLSAVYITDILAWLTIDFHDWINSYGYSEGGSPLYGNAYLYLNGEVITDLVIPEGATTIGNYALYDYDHLTSVVIPDSVTSIGNRAFSNCDALTSVTMGNGVTSIGFSAFYGCENLSAVYITDIAAWLSIDFQDSLFYGASLYLNEELLTDLVIPEGVTSIGDYAFCWRSTLTSVVIPDSVTSIGDYAFYMCSGLTSITIGNGVTSIGEYAFSYCSGLTSVTIPDSVTIIDWHAFSECDNLQDVYYGGTEEEWADAEIKYGNDCLTNATIHFESSGHSHIYTEVVTLPTYIKKGYTTHTCSTCGHSYVDSYVDPLPLPEAEVAVARMILGNELAMQFAFPKEDIVEGVDYVVSVTKTYADGRADKNILVPQSEWKTNGSYYYVSFNGIAAKEMGDTINVQILTAEGVTVGDVYTDSVQNYAIRQLQKTTHAKTRTLYVDMLNYGAAAQTYFKYDAENLVTDGLTPEEMAYGTKEVKLENNLVKGPGYGASQLNLASSIQLRVKFNGIDSSMYAIVKFTNHMGREIEARVEGSEFMYSGTVVVIDDVVAADYDRDVTITVYDADGKAVASAVESVASYIARMSGGAEIYSAVAKYCAAAYGYLHK